VADRGRAAIQIDAIEHLFVKLLPQGIGMRQTSFRIGVLVASRNQA
jgi:hypothetical protein